MCSWVLVCCFDLVVVVYLLRLFVLLCCLLYASCIGVYVWVYLILVAF